MAEHCPVCGEQLRPDAYLSWGGWHLDEAGKELIFADQRLMLTGTEIGLFGALLRARGRVVTRDNLYGYIYAMKHEADQSQDMKIIDVYIAKLRKKHKILRAHIDTVWGRGHALRPLPEPHAVPPEPLPLIEISKESK